MALCDRPEADSRVHDRILLNGLENGGPAGLIYGYLFVWIGATLQALVMAEMASMYVRTEPCHFYSAIQESVFLTADIYARAAGGNPSENLFYQSLF